MRRVSRPPEPRSLTEKGVEEREKAVAFYNGAWDGTSPFPYDAYRADDVKAVLEEAFAGKCAYCESVYTATQPMAVEHYRPKGAVRVPGASKPQPPGYYWLASTWTNLLPSCTDCNSPRRQDLPGGLATAGKANAFPLSSEAKRAREPGREADEARLLLHPYLDHPEKHLVFVWDTGTITDGWVEPRRSASGRTSAKGKATIEVCALQRRGLVKARRDVLINLVAHLETIAETLANMRRHPDDPELERQYERRMADTARFVAPGAPYSAMAEQVVVAYFRRLFG